MCGVSYYLLLPILYNVTKLGTRHIINARKEPVIERASSCTVKLVVAITVP